MNEFANGTRLPSVTQKVSREVTGLNGSIFVHVDFQPDGTPDAVRLSFKGKDNSTMDNIVTAVGDAITSILQEYNVGQD